MKTCSCAFKNTNADAQGVTRVLRAITSTGDVSSVLTGCAMGKLDSGCSHLRCLSWDESGPHFISGFIVMVEIMHHVVGTVGCMPVLWGWFTETCLCMKLSCTVTMFRRRDGQECFWKARGNFCLCEGALGGGWGCKNLIKTGRAATPFCNCLYNGTLSHCGAHIYYQMVLVKAVP